MAGGSIPKEITRSRKRDLPCRMSFPGCRGVFPAIPMGVPACRGGVVGSRKNDPGRLMDAIPARKDATATSEDAPGRRGEHPADGRDVLPG